jgi:ATP-dependent protease HslVU (ClpYQ) peptidase subunit
MTCIVGIVHEGKVILGADSAGVSSYAKVIRRDRKVFRNGELIFGFTSSFRMGQLLEFNLTPPPINEKQEAYNYAVKSLVPAVRDTLRVGGYTRINNGQEEGGVFLVGFRGRLFTIYSDFQVAESLDGIASVGCGEAYALGAMYTLSKETPMIRLQAGLDAAAFFSAGVSGPFHFIELESIQ